LFNASNVMTLGVISTLRLAVYRQSARLGAKSLEAHDQSFFPQLNPCGHSPCVISSLTRDGCQQSQIHSQVTIDGQSASQFWCQAPSEAQDQIFVNVRQLRFCQCGAPSLTRGRVCHLVRSKSVVYVIYIYNFTCRHST
jgi:hypothetical protein